MDNKGDVKKYTNQYLMVGKIAVGGDKLLTKTSHIKNCLETLKNKGNLASTGISGLHSRRTR